MSRAARPAPTGPAPPGPGGSTPASPAPASPAPASPAPRQRRDITVGRHQAHGHMAPVAGAARNRPGHPARRGTDRLAAAVRPSGRVPGSGRSRAIRHPGSRAPPGPPRRAGDQGRDGPVGRSRSAGRFSTGRRGHAGHHQSRPAQQRSARPPGWRERQPAAGGARARRAHRARSRAPPSRATRPCGSPTRAAACPRPRWPAARTSRACSCVPRHQAHGGVTRWTAGRPWSATVRWPDHHPAGHRRAAHQPVPGRVR